MKKNRKISTRFSSPQSSRFTSKDYNRVLSQFRSLSKALIDTSSIIYMHNAGFFEELARTVTLYAPQEIMDEAGFDGLPISVVPCHSGRRSNDHTLIACALARSMPVISEDKQVLLSLEREGISYFNSLMILHFLLFRKVIDAKTHAAYFHELTGFAWYNKQVLEFAKKIYCRIANPKDESSTGGGNKGQS
ncbi:MAG: hypothetical protein SWQ30_05615 [Thermodesulfobacteriota bacterium]|nr:hypothetical protein [Thermodesulfobacteriota bacterium]